MGVAKAVCGSCGAGVTIGAERCPACGEHLVWEEPAERACPSCGERVDPAAAFCPSCGARQTGAKKQHRGAQPKPARNAKAAARRGLEPWQLVSFVAIAALVAVLVYVELSRDHAPAGLTAGVPPASPGMPPMMQAPSAVDLAPLEAAVAADPRDMGALLQLANALHDNGQYLRAVETYTTYLATHPRNPDARVDMAVCYYELALIDSVHAGRYFGLAVEEMEAALRGTPTHQPAAFNLGVVHLQRGDLETSNRWFRKAVEMNPGSDLGQRAGRMLQQHSMTP